MERSNLLKKDVYNKTDPRSEKETKLSESLHKSSAAKEEHKRRSRKERQKHDEARANPKPDESGGLLKMWHLFVAYAIVIPFYLYNLMRVNDNFGRGARLSTSLFVFYCWLSMFKQVCFPDKDRDTRIPILPGILMMLTNVLYLAPLYQIITRNVQEPSNQRIGCSLCLFIFGMFIVMGTDCQKYFTLKVKKGLITEGFFKWTRNPNYLGEMMVFTSFLTLAND